MPGDVRRTAARAAALPRRVLERVNASRHRWPGWLDRAVRWVQWRLPRRVVLGLTGRGEAWSRDDEAAALAAMPAPPAGGIRLLVGPANFAGQGERWAQAVRRHVPDAGATSFQVAAPGTFGYPATYTVPRAVYHRSRPWQAAMLDHVVSSYTHVLLEAGRALFGERFRLDAFAEARELSRRGLAVAMMCHGTDVRSPSAHAERSEWSPFHDADPTLVPRLEARARRNREGLATLPGPVFVSTPDLLDDVPDAVWCPVVVEPDRWAAPDAPLERDVPVVLHAPSVTWVKGTAELEPVLRALEAEGLIEYRVVTGVPHDEMPALVRGADIVVDQLLLGLYGVLACEAMAAGRVVVGNVPSHVRRRVVDVAGGDVPLVQATPDTLADVIRRICDDRAWARRTAAQGPEFVRDVHDGRMSARRLSEAFLGVTP